MHDASGPEPTPQHSSLGQRRAWTIAFVVTPILALLGAFASLDLWKADLSIPFEYAHDSFLVTVPVKTMLEEGWWYKNPRLGAPEQMNFLDYPSSPNLHIGILKLMSIFGGNAFQLLNAYFLLSFPLIAVCTLAAFKTFRMAVVPSVVVSLIFSFAPYHYWRGVAHLWLACYFTVPLAMILVAWVAQNREGLLLDFSQGRMKWNLVSLPTLVAVLICASLGFDFPYYPMFAAFLLLVAGPFAAIRLGSWLPVVRSSALIVAIAGCFVLNLLPNVIYRLENGKNYSPTLVTHRPWNHAELYGLKIASLLMPAQEHPIAKFDRLGEKYLSGTVAPSEGAAPALGSISALGFLALIGWLLFKQNRERSNNAQTLDLMSILNVACLLLATIGGFSAVFNILSIGALRGYNRISIFIMFFSLVPVAMWIAYLQSLSARSRWRSAGLQVALGVIIIAGVIEQSRYFRMTGKPELAEYHSDRDFVGAITAQIGDQGKIFQYPIQNFLSYEGPAIRWDPYTHFRGYLHSDTLKWSFGAVTGRSGSQIQNWIGEHDIPQAVTLLALMNFNGIYIDRKLYDDGGKQVEGEIASLLKTQPIVSRNERLSFFPLQQYVRSLESSVAPEKLAQMRQQALSPLLVDWQLFDVEEAYPETTFRWCNGRKARLCLNNCGDTPREMTIRFSIATAHEEVAELQLSGLGISESLSINGQPSQVVRTLTVPPGQHHLSFRCDATPLVTPTRNVTFRVCDFNAGADADMRLALGDLIPKR